MAKIVFNRVVFIVALLSFDIAHVRADDMALPVLVSKENSSSDSYRVALDSFRPESRLRVVAVLSGNLVTLRQGRTDYTFRLLGSLALSKEAEEELRRLIGNRDVFLVYSPVGEYDENGRLTAYLYRADDGLFVNLDLIARGFAMTADRLGPSPELFLAAERKGRAIQEQKKAQAQAEAMRLAEEIRQNNERDEYKRARTAVLEAERKSREHEGNKAKIASSPSRKSYSPPLGSYPRSGEYSGGTGDNSYYGSNDYVNYGFSGSRSSSSGRHSSGRYYDGPRQPSGHYFGGMGSSHFGGHYMNNYTNNHYQRHH